MSGTLGTIADIIAPIAGGAIGSGLGELGGEVFGSGASSLLTPSMLADIGGALGGAGAGALVNKNRGVGALTGGLEGLLTGPQITNWLGIPGALGQSPVTPFLSSLFGGAGWGRGGSVQAGPGGVPGVTAASLGGAGAGAGGGQAGGGGGGAGGAGAADVPGSTAAAETALAPGAFVSGAGAPGTAGSGLGLGGGGNLAQIISALGLAGAAGGMGGGGGLSNMPEGGNLQKLADEAMGNAGLANSLRSGRLPPGAEQYADQAYADAAASIQSRYAAMGLSGSTMEAQDLAAAQARTEGMKFQMASDTSKFGMQQMQLADTIYAQIADYQLQQDQQLQDALAAFASAASGGAINYSVDGQGGALGLNQQQAA